MNFETKFKSLKTKLSKADIKKFSESFAFQVEMTDSDCSGIFYIAFIDGNYAVEPFDYVDNTAVITGSSAAIAKIASGSVDSSLTITGNATQVAMLANGFKKPAAKKPAAKKAEAKPAVKSVEKKAEAKPAAKSVEKKAEAKPTAKPAAKSAEKKAEAKPAK